MENILSSICEFVNGKICLDELNESTYISTENMLPNRGGITKASSLPSTTYSRLFLKEDVLVSNIRPYFKKIWIAKFDGGCSNDVLVFRAKSHIDSKFLYYLLSDDSFFEYATLTAKGTKMPRGDKIAIMNYEIPIFPLKEQQKISKILSSLDEKIEINRKINENLEDQAKEIFKRWFVDYEFPNEAGQPYKSNGGQMIESELGLIPKDWEISNVFENVDIIKDRNKNNLNLPVLSVVKEGKFVYSDEYFNKQVYSKNISKYKLVNEYDIAYNPSRANIGSIAMLKNFVNIGIISPIYVVFRLKEKIVPNFFDYYMKLPNFIRMINLNSSGTVRQNFDFNGFKNFNIIIPPSLIQKKFDEFIIKIENLILHNKHEIRKLSSLRDTLLPKLMTGEIDVSEIDI